MSVIPKEISRQGSEGLRVLWDDGHESVYPWVFLRERCPCAACTGEEGFMKAAVPQVQAAPDIRAEKILPVGRYAIHIRWSDGHETGIYSFEHLREICPCASCLTNR